MQSTYFRTVLAGIVVAVADGLQSASRKAVQRPFGGVARPEYHNGARIITVNCTELVNRVQRNAVTPGVNRHWGINLRWYREAVAHMKVVTHRPEFFIVSDEIPWCRENLADLGLGAKDSVVFVDNNTGENSFRDMHLMSLCKNMILINSTFSDCAAMLNTNPHKYVLSYNKRFNSGMI